jgi:hypothetical protein
MDIVCTHCDAPVPAELVNVARATAGCPACGAISEISDQLPAALRRRALERRRMAVPAGFRIQRIKRSQAIEDAAYRATTFTERDDLVIEWPWARNRSGLLGGVALALTIAAAMAVNLLGGPLVILAVVLSALASLYIAACAFLQQSRLTITADVLELTHGPLPVPGGWRLRADQIEQLFVEELRSTDEDGVVSSVYALVLIGRDRTRRRLLRFPTQAEADVIERTIENLLGIPDQPVVGEALHELPPGAHR